MEYGSKNFMGVGLIIGEPVLSANPKNGVEWVTFPVAFDKSEDPASTFEITVNRELAKFAKGLEVGQNIMVQGSFLKRTQKIDLERDVYACNDIILFGDKILKVDEPKRLFFKATIYGRISSEPEMIQMKNRDEKFLKCLARVNYTFKKGDDQVKDVIFFEFSSFKKTAEFAYNDLIKGEYAYLECSLKRDINKEGVWPSFIMNYYHC